MLTFKHKSNFFFEQLPSYENGYLDVGQGHKIYYEQFIMSAVQKHVLQ